MKQLGIEYTIFEYSGQQKKKIMDFRSAPGNLNTGMEVMRKKFGICNNTEELKEHVQNHVKNIITGKVIRR